MPTQIKGLRRDQAQIVIGVADFGDDPIDSFASGPENGDKLPDARFEQNDLFPNAAIAAAR